MFDSEDELEDFLRDAAMAPLRNRSMRFPYLAPSEVILSGLSPEETHIVKEVAIKHNARRAGCG